MQLTVLGLNHKSAPVEVRERFNLSEERIKEILAELRDAEDISEAIILSTCNRTEFYIVIDNPEKTIPYFKNLLEKISG